MEVINNPNEENGNFKPWGLDINTYGMFMHFSQFAGYLAPVAGFVLPIFMWVANKDQSPIIDAHGKNIVNWILSSLIYYIISGILVLLLIGIVGLIFIPILSFLFALIGAVKAGNGEIYEYPFTITFIK